MMADDHARAARGRRILVVEDEFFIAEDLRLSLERLGAEVLGPVATVDDALELLARDTTLDGATLDVTLGQEKSYPVADALRDRGLPFVLLTGYDDRSLPDRLADVPRCLKPFDVRRIVEALFV